jgi:hypothetical protein
VCLAGAQVAGDFFGDAFGVVIAWAASLRHILQVYHGFSTMVVVGSTQIKRNKRTTRLTLARTIFRPFSSVLQTNRRNKNATPVALDQKT